MHPTNRNLSKETAAGLYRFQNSSTAALGMEKLSQVFCRVFVFFPLGTWYSRRQTKTFSVPKPLGIQTQVL